MTAAASEVGAGRTNRFARDLFEGLPARYDVLAEVLSFGQNRRWRNTMVDHVAKRAPERVLDVAAGTCGVTASLIDSTGAWVVAIDLSEAMLRRGRSNLVRQSKLPRTGLVLGRAEQLPFPDACFDALTFTYLLRYVEDPVETLTEMSRVVRPGGVVASLEFAVPDRSWAWAPWWLYTRALLPVLGWLAGGREWLRVGEFLGPSISNHYRRFPMSWTVEAWRRAGLTGVGTRSMSFGGGVVMWGERGGG